MVAFSRLQLAAALIEYDNDDDDPSHLRSAQDSAIFSHIRTRNAPRARTLSGFEHLRETPNLLGVDIPSSDPGGGRGNPDPRRSVAGTRNSRSSVDVLRNPFGDDILESEQGVDDEKSDDEEDGEDLEVDLEAWGMTNFLGKEKDKPRSKDRRSGQRTRQPSKTQSEVMSTSQSRLSVDEFGQLNASTRRAAGARSKSIGSVGIGDDPLLGIQGGAAVASEADFRRRSISMGLSFDAAARKISDSDDPFLSATGPAQRQHNRTRTQSQQFDMQSIPFPSSSPVPPEENEEDNIFSVPLTSYTSRFDPKTTTRMRTMSNGSLNSQTILDYRLPNPHEATDENPTALRPTSPFGATWFDPSGAPALSSGPQGFPPMSDVDSRARVSSVATMGTQGNMDDNPFSLPLPSPSRVSRFDPKVTAHARTISNASFGSRHLDLDRTSVASGHILESDVRQTRRYSRLELMRPKVLIMPSPLQGAEEPPPSPNVPPGFQLSTVGPPLPPGAQSAARPISRAFSSMDGLQVPASSNSFTPNPRTSMSLSQLTFRNTLMSGGQRDVAYVDIENGLRRAEEDGEQIYQEEDIEEEVAEEQKQASGKPPGKLYGRSLMDELQARKDKIRSKQRVFTGDERPSMMSRGQIRRSSTLIDPATLQDRPQSQTIRRPPMRRGSSSSKPLLDFSDESPATGAPNAPRMQNSKSVFGVDSLWERELAKLAEIEAAEKAEEEERMRQEEERQRMEEEKAAKKAKGKGKGKGKGKRKRAARGESPETVEDLPRPSAVGDLPPTLPAIPKTTARRPRQPIANAYDSESDSEASESAAKAKAAARQEAEVGWESSDDEGRRRGARNTASDSEDDVPLARHIPAIRPPASDSEDEKPLARVLERKSMMPDIDFDNLPGLKSPVPADDDEDDTPLALQRPHVQSFVRQSTAANNDEDDDDDEAPLGLKQAQRAQFNMMSQQHMMEMQLRNSMAFGAPSMLNPFPPFVMSPPVLGTVSAPYDPGKYQSVDRWRHNVATE